jgi:hypothetical protein
MIALTYTSRATRPLTTPELVQLLRVARAHNAASGVTGLLLYAEESFLQKLEGEPEAVDAVFERIRVDARHQDIRIVSHEEIAQPTYAGWSMGFGFPEPEQLAQVLPGFEPTFVAPLADESRLDDGTAQLLLAMVAATVDDPAADPVED